MRCSPLAFLSGYDPRVFDAVLASVEPCERPGQEPDMEPFCRACGGPVGIFLAHGTGYRHYRGALTAASRPRPYQAGHAPVIGWRPAAPGA